MRVDSFYWERDDHYIFSEITLMPYDDGHYGQTWLGNYFFLSLLNLLRVYWEIFNINRTRGELYKE